MSHLFSFSQATRSLFLLSIVALGLALFPVDTHAALKIHSTIKLDEDTANGVSTAGTLEEYDLYGTSVSGLGDLNNDGVQDLLVGAAYDEGDPGGSEDSGVVYIHYMNTDGSIDSTVALDEDTANGASSVGTLNPSDYYGFSVANIGDLNNDGVNDILVGAPQDEGEVSPALRSGAAYIHFMNTNGTIDSTVKLDQNTANGASSVGTLNAEDRYGISVTSIGDLNNDGVVELLIGAFRDEGEDSATPDSGAAYIHFMNTNGSIDSTVKLDEDTTNGASSAGLLFFDDRYGSSVVGMGDLNGDSVEDILVGALRDEGEVGDTTDSGAVYIHFMNTNGSIDSTVKLDEDTANGASSVGTLNFSDGYGISAANIGDQNDDGVVDIAIGAFADEGEVGDTTDSGAVYIHFMNTNGSIDSSVKIDEDTTNGATSVDPLSAADQYGYAVANMGDLNEDGKNDIAIGAPYNTSQTTQTFAAGGAYIHLLATGIPISGTVYTDAGVTTIANGTQVEVFVDGVSAGTTTTTSGVYSFAAITVTNGDVITVFIDNGSQYGATVTKTNGSSALTNLDIYGNTLITRNDSGTALTNGNLDTGNPGTESNLTAVYANAAGAGTFTSGAQLQQLRIPSGHVFAPGGTMDVNGDVYLAGTLTLTTETIQLEGDWTRVTGSTLSAGTSTVRFDGSASQNMFGSSAFSTFTIADTGARTIGIEKNSTQTISGIFNAALSTSGIVNIRTVNTSGTVLSDNSTHTVNVTGSFGTTTALNVRDSILQEDGVVKSPELDPAQSTDSGNTQGWFSVATEDDETEDGDTDEEEEGTEEETIIPTYSLTQTVLKPTKGKATVGDTVRYRITVTNTGATTLAALRIKNSYPERRIQFVSSSLETVDSTNDGVLVWSNVITEPVASGASTSFTVTYRVTAVPAEERKQTVMHTVYGRNGRDVLNTPTINVKNSNTDVGLRGRARDAKYALYIVNPDGRKIAMNSANTQVTIIDNNTNFLEFEDNVDRDFNDVSLFISRVNDSFRFDINPNDHDAMFNHEVWFEIRVKGELKKRMRLWKNSSLFEDNQAKTKYVHFKQYL